MNTPTAAKKNVTKLQRAIVDGLEDVKAQDIRVFNTEHLSPLFERVIVASGTSNRQTKALAASVRDCVREAGFDKPRTEGEDNGEWIIVDCGQAVVHIMQPTFRLYYNLEELWGEKAVRVKLGAPKPAPAAVAAKSGRTVKTAAAAAATPSLKRASAARKGVAEAFPSKAAQKKAAVKTGKPAAVPRQKPAAPSSAASNAVPAVKAARKAAPQKAVASKAPASARPVRARKPATKPAS